VTEQAMPQVSAADIARVMPPDFSDLLNQRDDTALRPGVSDVGERLGQGNAFPLPRRPVRFITDSSGFPTAAPAPATKVRPQCSTQTRR
jgi:hypothetical protein